MKDFGFVLARKAEHSIAMMCRVLEVSRSGYHAWASLPPSAGDVPQWGSEIGARQRARHNSSSLRGERSAPQVIRLP
ncbi:MAG TPA: hypothetical protein VMY78_12950 [Solirubrobacteraceae bacterium]|nr:hypothetical protein [Solirubrobacteraceae bacterium]